MGVHIDRIIYNAKVRAEHILFKGGHISNFLSLVHDFVIIEQSIIKKDNKYYDDDTNPRIVYRTTDVFINNAVNRFVEYIEVEEFVPAGNKEVVIRGKNSPSFYLLNAPTDESILLLDKIRDSLCHLKSDGTTFWQPVIIDGVPYLVIDNTEKEFKLKCRIKISDIYMFLSAVKVIKKKEFSAFKVSKRKNYIVKARPDMPASTYKPKNISLKVDSSKLVGFSNELTAYCFYSLIKANEYNENVSPLLPVNLFAFAESGKKDIDSNAVGYSLLEVNSINFYSYQILLKLFNFYKNIFNIEQNPNDFRNQDIDGYIYNAFESMIGELLSLLSMRNAILIRYLRNSLSHKNVGADDGNYGEDVIIFTDRVKNSYINSNSIEKFNLYADKQDLKTFIDELNLNKFPSPYDAEVAFATESRNSKLTGEYREEMIKYVDLLFDNLDDIISYSLMEDVLVPNTKKLYKTSTSAKALERQNNVIELFGLKDSIANLNTVENHQFLSFVERLKRIYKEKNNIPIEDIKRKSV